MNRVSLSNAMQALATERGYDFHAISAEYMPAIVSQKPTLIMLHPEFKSIQGRQHGKVTYSLTLHLMQNGAKASPNERIHLIDHLEDEILEMLSDLSNHDSITTIEQVSISPSALKLTVAGEVAVTATCEVTCLF